MIHILSFHLHLCHHPSCQFHLHLHRCSCLCTSRICEPCACAAVLLIWQLYHVLLDDSVANKYTIQFIHLYFLNYEEYRTPLPVNYYSYNYTYITIILQINCNHIYNCVISQLLMHRTYAAYCERSHTALSVCISIGHDCEPCKNGWINQHDIWGVGPRNHVLNTSSDSLTKRVNLGVSNPLKCIATIYSTAHSKGIGHSSITAW